MKPAVVVDVGNSFIKWGRCDATSVIDNAYLAADDIDAWQQQRAAWKLEEPTAWAVAGVAPESRDGLVKWLRQQGDEVIVMDSAARLPLRVLVDQPDRVGIDRLLDAVAANAMRRADAGAVVIDAGSAVTVDWVDASGAFCGGAILPGLRLMAQTLHDYTALLPMIQVNEAVPLPGRSTTAAMEAGIFRAVVHGIRAIAYEMLKDLDQTDIFLTGGDVYRLAKELRGFLVPSLAKHFHLVPLLTLEGIRIAAEALS